MDGVPDTIFAQSRIAPQHLGASAGQVIPGMRIQINAVGTVTQYPPVIAGASGVYARAHGRQRARTSQSGAADGSGSFAGL